VSEVFSYYDKAVRGTEHEDMLVILQFLKGMIGQQFSFLNFYKEIPVSYNATLLNVENEMAEFSVHEYQAKVISMEKKTLIHSHPRNPFSEDMIGEAFYVSSAKKRVILCNFGYAHIRSGLRRFVRVLLDGPVEAELQVDGKQLKGVIKDLSLGGAAISAKSSDTLVPGLDINIILRLPEHTGNSRLDVAMSATIIKVVDNGGLCACVIEFHADKHAQQQIAYYINHRQVEIIKELKDVNV